MVDVGAKGHPILGDPVRIVYRSGPGGKCRLRSPRVGGKALANRGPNVPEWPLSHDGLMILEHVVLDVVPGEEGAFEEAFSQAKLIISAATGFRSLRLGRCVERASRHLLLVEWDELEDHTKGFRGSAGYEEWKGLLHRFYDPFPIVDHYEDLVIVEGRTDR